MAKINVKQANHIDTSLNGDLTPKYPDGQRTVYEVTQTEDTIRWKIGQVLEVHDLEEIIRLGLARVIVK